MSTIINYDDLARLEYGRLLWRNPRQRVRLLQHWADPRHPYRERFLQHRVMVERLLESTQSDDVLDRQLRTEGTSLRVLVREIPPVFGSFWH